jgi:hypothetical protein
MDQLPASVVNEEEDVQGLETDRMNHDEVGRPDALELVGQECAPTLSIRLPVRSTPAVAPDGAVADDDAKLEQLSRIRSVPHRRLSRDIVAISSRTSGRSRRRPRWLRERQVQ